MSHFRRDVEGLRAVAILLVVAYHAGVPFVTGGYVGVDVFFVLSGYLITSLLVRELDKSGRIDLDAEDETFRLQRQVASRHDNVATIDMTSDICPNQSCELLQSGVVTYRDAGHLTTEFSLRLADPLSRKIDAGLTQLAKRPAFAGSISLLASQSSPPQRVDPVLQ